MRGIRIPTAKKLPSGNWHIEMRLGGHPVYVTERSRAACEKKALLIKSQHKNGIAVEKEKRESRTMTVGDVIDSYIESRTAILSPSTIRGYKEIRRLRFKTITSKPVAEIRSWQSVVNDESKLCSAKTLKNAWGLLRSALNAEGISVGTVRTPMVAKNEHSFLEPDQIKIIVSASYGTDYEAPLLLGLHGLRKSEIYALDCSDIKDGFIHIHGAVVRNDEGERVRKKTNKTDDSNRIVPVIISRVEELIAGRSGPVCTDVPESTYKRIRKAAVENGLPEIGFHSLRHSFASLCYSLGISEAETMKLGGWSDITVMRKIYTHLASKDRSAASEKLKNFFSEGA